MSTQSLTFLFFTLFLVSCNHGVSSYTFAIQRSIISMRKGRPSLRKTSGSSKRDEFVGGKSSPKKANWVPVQGVKSLSDLPTEENKVNLIDTMASQLKDARVNPTGAVGVINYKGKTYCISAACSSCKIPMTKAKILEPNEETKNVHPRVVCDFCGATYNVKTGEVITDANADRGLLGGLVKGLFSSKEKNTLPTFDLGESNGMVVINLP